MLANGRQWYRTAWHKVFGDRSSDFLDVKVYFSANFSICALDPLSPFSHIDTVTVLLYGVCACGSHRIKFSYIFLSRLR